MRSNLFALGLLAWAAVAAAGPPKKDKASGAEPIFQVAYPNKLTLDETFERTSVKSFQGTTGSESTRSSTRLKWSADPAGGWVLESTLQSSTLTRNGAPASDPVAEMMIGLPVLIHIDAHGKIGAITGFEKLSTKLDALGVGPDLRALLERALNPQILASKAKADLDSRLGVLAGQPVQPGLSIQRTAADGTALGTWTLGGPVACPPGMCIETHYELPLSAGVLDLGSGISATLDSGKVTGSLVVDASTSLPWHELKSDERVMSVTISGKTTQGTVEDHVERNWTVVP